MGIFALLLLLVGGGMVWWGLKSRGAAAAGAAAAGSWPTAPGIVEAAEVVQRSGEAETGLRSTLQSHYYFVPEVRYRYTVAGQDYVGSRLRFGRFAFQTSGGAQAVLAAYPPGGPIAVRYDPVNPIESVVELATANAIATQFIVFGALIGTGGLVMLLVAFARLAH